jgi:molecular chaperone DnaK (HSP70)
MKPTSGFDFGTSTTLVASSRGVVNIGEEVDWMPSVVGYDDDGSIVVGERAAGLDEEFVVGSIKRSITERRDFVRVDTPTGVRDVRVDTLIAPLLAEALRRGVAAGQQLTQQGAVAMGCPAMWDGRQRRRMLALAQEAGLGVTLDSFVDEPVAAGIAWLASHQEDAARPMRILVFDMGGGTLDVAVLDVRGLKRHEVSVLAAVGIAEAGDDLDRALAEDLEFVLAATGVDIDSLPSPSKARLQVKRAARLAKIALSKATEADRRLHQRLFGRPVTITYTREQLEGVFEPQMDRAEMIVLAALRAARLTEATPASAYDIARTPVEDLVRSVQVVLLSGGMSQIPYVRERLALLFPDALVEPATANTEDAVAIGLAKAGQYGRVNMFRPGFDVLVEWEGGEYRTVYEAFTPLVESWQIIQGGSDLRYTRNGMDLSLPRKAKGKLRVVSHSGQPVRATLGGKRLDGFPVALTEQKFEFSVYPNGRIRLTDANQTYEGQIDDWHTMEGA